jgi:indolepyruvate ferredoxin oxidoreductase
MERDLIADYEALVATVLDELTFDRIDEAVAVLNHVEIVRGFGPVKNAAVEEYRRTLPSKVAAFRAPVLALR